DLTAVLLARRLDLPPVDQIMETGRRWKRHVPACDRQWSGDVLLGELEVERLFAREIDGPGGEGTRERKGDDCAQRGGGSEADTNADSGLLGSGCDIERFRDSGLRHLDRYRLSPGIDEKSCLLDAAAGAIDENRYGGSFLDVSELARGRERTRIFRDLDPELRKHLRRTADLGGLASAVEVRIETQVRPYRGADCSERGAIRRQPLPRLHLECLEAVADAHVLRFVCHDARLCPRERPGNRHRIGAAAEVLPERAIR